MKRVVLGLIGLVISACGGGDEGGPKTYSDECVYISTQHSFYDPGACATQGEALSCESAEIVDRSEADRNVYACVYKGCSEDFDCTAFRRL